jgi:hypothetical protein
MTRAGATSKTGAGESPAKAGQQNRRTPRHRVLKAGTIEFGGGAIDCTVRNLSDAGAALDIASPVGIPDKFILFLQTDGSRHRCVMRWRMERRIGVAFE